MITLKVFAVNFITALRYDAYVKPGHTLRRGYYNALCRIERLLYRVLW